MNPPGASSSPAETSTCMNRRIRVGAEPPLPAKVPAIAHPDARAAAFGQRVTAVRQRSPPACSRPLPWRTGIWSNADCCHHGRRVDVERGLSRAPRSFAKKASSMAGFQPSFLNQSLRVIPRSLRQALNGRFVAEGFMTRMAQSGRSAPIVPGQRAVPVRPPLCREAGRPCHRRLLSTGIPSAGYARL